MDNQLLWKGPNWLHLSQEYWPLEPSTLTTAQLKEINREWNPAKVLVTYQVTPLIDNARGEFLFQCSGIKKVVHTLAWIRRFITNCRSNRDNRQIGPLTPAELNSARLEWIKHRQYVYFHADTSV